MELLRVIRRWALRDQLSICGIACKTGLSRNTIRKYLCVHEVEPAFKVPRRSSKLDAFDETLSAWLKLETGRPRKQRRAVKQLHADLVVLGFDGSYSRLAAFARTWIEHLHHTADGDSARHGPFVLTRVVRGKLLEEWAGHGLFHKDISAHLGQASPLASSALDSAMMSKPKTV